MAIPDFARSNFDTLLRAAQNGDLALVECHDTRTGEPRYVLCAVGRDGTDLPLTPFGHLADGNPYEIYRPPDMSAPFYSPHITIIQQGENDHEQSSE